MPLYEKKRSGQRGQAAFDNAAGEAGQLTQQAVKPLQTTQAGANQQRRDFANHQAKQQTVDAYRLRQGMQQQAFAQEQARENSIRQWTETALRDRNENRRMSQADKRLGLYEKAQRFDQQNAIMERKRRAQNDAFTQGQAEANFGLNRDVAQANLVSEFGDSAKNLVDPEFAGLQKTGSGYSAADLVKNPETALGLVRGLGYNTQSLTDPNGEVNAKGQEIASAASHYAQENGVPVEQAIQDLMGKGYGAELDGAEDQAHAQKADAANKYLGPDAIGYFKTKAGKALDDEQALTDTQRAKRKAKTINSRKAEVIKFLSTPEGRKSAYAQRIAEVNGLDLESLKKEPEKKKGRKKMTKKELRKSAEDMGLDINNKEDQQKWIEMVERNRNEGI